ncbi:hypothetical protein JCM10213_002099 [Rhodosporidiobolus nylandii]
MECIMDNEPTSSSPTAPPLLRLPVELLEAIFELAYEGGPDGGPVCRTLLPMHRRGLYSAISLTTYAALARLQVALSEDNARLVHSLRLKMETDRGGVSDWYTRQHEAQDFVQNFLLRLTNLKCLRLYYLRPLYLGTFLTDPRAPLHLTNLRTLELLPLVDPFALANPLDMLFLQHLHAYSSLTSLSIRVSKHTAHLLYSSSTAAPADNITSVRLQASAFGRWTVPGHFASAFPRLRSLELHNNPGNPSDPSTFPDFRGLLSVAPVGLTSLVLFTRAPREPVSYPDRSVNELLGRFTNLERLNMGAASFTPDALGAVLSTLPRLEYLAFQERAPVTDQLLFSILEPPHRLPALKHLVLKHVFAKYGTRLASVEWKLSPTAAATPFHVYPDWVAPVWPSGGTSDGIRAAVKSARRAGINIEGSAVQALHWERRYRAERDACAMLWGAVHDDYTEARELLGEKAVNDFIRKEEGTEALQAKVRANKEA